MKVFVAALDEGSLAGAARKLGRSPAAVSRAVSFLETHIGAQLLHRTTRSIKLSDTGERYAAACRQVLTDLEEADTIASSERSVPRGILTLTAPVVSGEVVLRPILNAFMDAFPEISARLYLLDRQVNLIDEGRRRRRRRAPHRSPSGLDLGRDPGRRGSSCGGGRAALPGAAPAHRGAGRPGEAPDHCICTTWPRLVELPAFAGLPRAANNPLRAPPSDQLGPRSSGLCRRWAWRYAFVVVSGRRACAERRARDRTIGRGTAAAARSSDLAARSALSSESPCLCGLCCTTASESLRISGE